MYWIDKKVRVTNPPQWLIDLNKWVVEKWAFGVSSEDKEEFFLSFAKHFSSLETEDYRAEVPVSRYYTLRRVGDKMEIWGSHQRRYYSLELREVKEVKR